MTKKIFKIMALLTLISAACAFVLWGAINYYFIPKVIIPKAPRYIDENINGKIKLVIGKISYKPFEGFELQDIRLKDASAAENSYIIIAKKADIDLALLPLLKKRIDVENIDLYGADLNISRDANGRWNFQILNDLGIMEEKGKAQYGFLIRTFTAGDGVINYTDQMHKDNTLERKYDDVKVSVKCDGKGVYSISFRGNGYLKEDESFESDIIYDKTEDYLSAAIKMNTKYVSDYWQYYLDDALRPWHLEAESAGVNLDISYINGTFSSKGECQVKDSILEYGDLCIKGDISMAQNIKYEKGLNKNKIGRIDINMESFLLNAGEKTLIEKGRCGLVIRKEGIEFETLSGDIMGYPFNLNGKFVFGKKKELILNGRICDFGSNFDLKLLSENSGNLLWTINKGNSAIKIYADIGDIKDMLFNMKVNGVIYLEEVFKGIKGRAQIKGNLIGEADDPMLLKGDVFVEAKDLSAWGIMPLNLDLNMNFTNGVLSGEVPESDYCKGRLKFKLMAETKRWGAEFVIDKGDLKEFVKDMPRMKGAEGTLSGNLAVTGSWRDIKSLKGGGYIKITKCKIWDAPIFSDAEKGIESITSEVEMPVIKNAEGNYGILNGNLNIENLFCDASSMDINLSGKISFSGDTDITAGAKLMGKGMFRIMKNVLVPVTIGIDMITNCIQVKITGKLPDLKQHAFIQPMGWLKDIFPVSGKAEKDRYGLEELWNL